MKKVLISTIVASILCVSGQGMAIETKAKNALLMDAGTGYVMLNKNADKPMPPASMSKLMTAYMIFDALKKGEITLDTEFTVSENAWRKGGAKSGSSTMFLKPNQKVRVGDLIRGIIIQSGNDACIVAAENMAGSEDVFADMMTQKGKDLGLKNATFKNATGLPQKGHEMSAQDLAILAQALIHDFPEYYGIYSEKEFSYNGIKQGNRNPLLYGINGADGLKTGHTTASGFGLTGSVKTNDDRRLILVINGLKSMKERSDESKKLVGWGTTAFENIELAKPNQTIVQVPVWLGKANQVAATITEDIPMTIQRGRTSEVKGTAFYNEPITAPIQKGQKVGTLVVTGPDNQSKTVDLVASENIARVGYFGKLKAVVSSWFN